jgi:transcriptional regulator of acetoin/glycerol metabolism
VKVVQQNLFETEEDASNLAPGRYPIPPRPTGTAKFPPLTGVLTTDATGNLVVRRVRVRVTSGPDRGREALLEAGTLLIGTHSDNDLILRDTHASKYHLEIALVAGGVRVRDLGSETGTFVGNGRLQVGVVPIGTELGIGRTTLQLLAGDTTVPIAPSERNAFGPALGQSLVMRQLFAVLERIAPSDAPLLLEGEPGTGRTLLAKAIHANSRFASSPITVIDFRLPVGERPTVASVGQRSDTFTLLLERIDEASASEASALLNLYQRREEGVLDARIIATASTDLRSAAADGRFRKELAAHVAAVRIVVPPLRERLEDVPLLVRQFAREICGTEPPLGPAELSRIVARAYPGNVKELRQLVARALQPDTAAPVLPRQGTARARAALVMPLNARPKPPEPAVARERLVDFFERDWILGLHAKHHGNLHELTRETAIPRKELVRRLKSWGIPVNEK